MACETDLHLKATELRLGLPRSDEADPSSIPTSKSNNYKRASTAISEESKSSSSCTNQHCDKDVAPPPAKTQVVGWPPIRSYRKNCFHAKEIKEVEGTGMYVKVSMDGAPYLRKIDLYMYKSYRELLKALENMFKLTIGEYSERKGYNGSDYVPTYEDKDGDWMLVGDVPIDMFISSCKRLRIMRRSEARGFGSL